MASTAQKRQWWADWECEPSKMVRVGFPGSASSNWNLLVADASVPAWQTFAALMRKHSYYFQESAGGTYNCRNISGSSKKSLHSYGIAVDLNPSRNSFGQTNHDFPQGFIDDVLATGLFRWGIDFADPMHWEIDVPPEEIGDDTMTKAEILAALGLTEFQLKTLRDTHAAWVESHTGSVKDEQLEIIENKRSGGLKPGTKFKAEVE